MVSSLGRLWRVFVLQLRLKPISVCEQDGALEWGARPAYQFLFSRNHLEGLACHFIPGCLKRTVSCISSIERSTGSLHFNHSLCETFVTNYVSPARELLEKQQLEIQHYSEQCAPVLTALHKTFNEADFLIQKHCASSNWLWAAVELVENTSAFAEAILDIKWYTRALQIAIEVSRGTSPRSSRQRKQTDLVWNLQNSAMKEHEDVLAIWERECEQLSLHGERAALLSKLKVVRGAEIRCVSSYLAQKLLVDHMHAREALAVKLNVPELLHKKNCLGQGAYGKVYEVQWLGMRCALKQMATCDVDEVIPEEVRILSKLHHPNIVQLYGYFFERGTLYLMMELMDDSLKEYVKTKEWITLQSSPHFLLVALDCMLQIAKGVRYLHSKKMAHRDLKGDNVVVKPSENPDRRCKGYLSVKLTDFGLAKANLKYSTYSSLVNAGSRPWKAPELFRVVSNNVDRSNIKSKRKYYPMKPDIYSFGIVCAEILSGTEPFSSAELHPTSEFYAKVKGGVLRPKLPEKILPPGLADYIKRCWDTDPLNRPDFVDICKRIRHFRDSLLQITTYVGRELKTQERITAIEETCTSIDDIDCIDIPEEEWDWIIDYEDIIHKEALRAGSAFASVYPARLKPSSKQVLAKYIEVTRIDSDEKIASFKQEVGLLARIRHPNLVPYLGATKRIPFVVVTEFAQGLTLRKFFKTTTTLSQRDALRIAFHVASGMACLHEEHVAIIHGELSPDCVIIDQTSDQTTVAAKVADFGLHEFRKEPSRHCLPRLFRRAPEQHSNLPWHKSVDVFSFGMILYELLEYKDAQAFWKNKHASKKLQAGERPELRLSNCYPRGVHALIKRCWSQNAQERPSFESVVSDLRKLENRFSSSVSNLRSN